MARVLATVSGVAIKPGVSLNRRWYRPEMLADAVSRAQQRIAAGEALNLTERNGEAPAGNPLTQLTHHAAEDDSTRIVGRITSLSLGKGGEVCYEAALAPTPAGKTIAALLDTSDGQPPYLRGVSIRGAWLGKVREVTGPDGQPATTADGLELDGLDYTGTPGVPGAQVTSFAWSEGKPEESGGRVLITESVQEARVTISEETAPPPPQPPAAVSEALARMLPRPPGHRLVNGQCVTCPPGTEPAAFADLGYRGRLYPVDTEEHARASWRALAEESSAKGYTGAQHRRVTARAAKALRDRGLVDLPGGFTGTPAAQAGEAVAEYMGGSPATSGSWSINACNGPVCINLSSYGMDPSDLDVILRAASDAACTALARLDPDMDGDIDVKGAPSADTDHDQAGEAAPAAEVTETAGPPGPPGDVEEAGGKKPPPTGVTDAIRSAFLSAVGKDTPVDIAAGMRRLSQWAASGHYPAGCSYSDLKWFYDQCAKELRSRDPKSTAGGNFPPAKSGS